jgi:hypothetical protein
MNHRTLLLAPALLLLLAGCDRYAELPRCGAYFSEGDNGSFVLENDGTARDTQTGTRWYRCNAGQRFSAGQCLGNPMESTLADAQVYAKEFSEASGKVWRLPTLREMGSLKQTTCQNPSINTQVFPGVLVNSYWTSSSSPNGPGLGCSHYTFSGNSFCREHIGNARPFMLVLD